MPSKTGVHWNDFVDAVCKCGKVFQRRRWMPRRRWCSANCAQKYNVLRTRDKVLLRRRQVYQKQRVKLLERARRFSEKKAKTRFKLCRNCGKSFNLCFGQLPHCFCSLECKKEAITKHRQASELKRRKDPRNRIHEAVRGTLRDYLRRRRVNFGGSIWKALGYTVDDLKRRLECQFTKEDGFTWENYGKVWHIDHKKPHNHFSYASMESPSFRQAWALSNLQPLSAHENTSKQDRFVGRMQVTKHYNVTLS